MVKIINYSHGQPGAPKFVRDPKVKLSRQVDDGGPPKYTNLSSGGKGKMPRFIKDSQGEK